MSAEENVRLSTLGNGLRVISDRVDSVASVAVGVWVEVGSRDEVPTLAGASHVLEHMAFKGTQRRSARAIAEEIEAVGGHLNAYTSHEHTVYYAKVLKEDTPLAVDLLADIVRNPAMDPEELERELAVIVQEIRHVHDTPDDIVFDRFQETAFPGQGLGQSVLGTIDRVQGLRREALLAYLAAHYSAERMIVAAAGAVEHRHLVDLAADAFGGLARGNDAVRPRARYAGGEYREARPIEQLHLVLGFNGVAYDDPDFHALSVFSTLFGGGMSSRLFQEVRESRGLAYSIHSFVSNYVDTGLFGIYAGTGEAEAAELVALVCAECAKVRADVADDEVARARAQIRAGILMSLESPSARAERIARQLMVFGRAIPIAEMVARIEAVDADAVRRVAGRVLATPPTVAALGLIGSVEPLERIAERLR